MKRSSLTIVVFAFTHAPSVASVRPGHYTLDCEEPVCDCRCAYTAQGSENKSLRLLQVGPPVGRLQVMSTPSVAHAVTDCQADDPVKGRHHS